jgi:hypothetical protein
MEQRDIEADVLKRQQAQVERIRGVEKPKPAVEPIDPTTAAVRGAARTAAMGMGSGDNQALYQAIIQLAATFISRAEHEAGKASFVHDVIQALGQIPGDGDFLRRDGSGCFWDVISDDTHRYGIKRVIVGGKPKTKPERPSEEATNKWCLKVYSDGRDPVWIDWDMDDDQPSDAEIYDPDATYGDIHVPRIP